MAGYLRGNYIITGHRFHYNLIWLFHYWALCSRWQRYCIPLTAVTYARMARDLIEVKHLGQGALRATLLHWGFVEGAPWFSDRRGYRKKMAEKGSVAHSMRSDKVEIRCTLLGCLNNHSHFTAPYQSPTAEYGVCRALFWHALASKYSDLTTDLFLGKLYIEHWTLNICFSEGICMHLAN